MQMKESIQLENTMTNALFFIPIHIHLKDVLHQKRTLTKTKIDTYDI
jgi:hypothetical protein